MKCPACSHELMQFVIGGVTVDACEGGCAGIWFDGYELQRVDDQHEIAGDTVLCLQRDPKIVVDHQRKRECPRCHGIKLRRHYYSAAKLVEVDQCPNCGGYWLDQGELEKIRAEKAQSTRTSAAKPVGLSMETIRFLYQQKMNQSPRT